MSVYKLATVITAHAWSPDGSRVAVCENEPDVIIYSNANSPDVAQWKKEHILKNHTMVVVGIDWCPRTNKIVTCSHDVNAFVWTFDQKKNKWTPKLSILRINRAALKCRWSPDGTKFAVASGSKVVPVCYYEANQDWWVSKMIKKHRSTVIDVAWHPTSQVLATASSDFKCRIFSAFIPENDKQAAKTVFGDLDRLDYGTLITEFEAKGGWIQAVAWAPNGNGLAFAGHDSTVSFVSFATGQPVCVAVRSQGLPYTCMMFLSDNVLAAAGYDFQPEIYQMTGANSWALLGSPDKGEGKKAAGGGGLMSKVKIPGFSKSKEIWEKKVKEGVTRGSGTDNLMKNHHNVITDMAVCSRGGFSTSGADGRIVVWGTDVLKKNVDGISL